MSKMRFDVKCVRDCLVNNGIVYTVRAWEGYNALSKVEVDGVGLCTKKRVLRVNRKEDLTPYVSLSGFLSIDEWWAKIRSFGACDGWLFEVRVIPASPSPTPALLEKKDNTERIAFTGHRHLQNKDVVSALDSIHAKYPDAIWITGGAIGLDSHAAEYARTHGIPLWLILPFPPKVMTLKWNAAQKAMLELHIKYCAKLSVLSPVYKVSVYQDRNVRMVDLSTRLSAFFDGSPGGTANCVRYARSIGHPIEMCL